jgi:E3 ubiquitin-protein ligase RNF14
MEGDIRRVCCPDPECVKAGREAEEEEVVRVVNEDELRRWRWLKEKRILDKGLSHFSRHDSVPDFQTDPTIIHCPMNYCQSAVARPAVEESNGYDRLRTCAACGYSFCSFCKRTW